MSNLISLGTAISALLVSVWAAWMSFRNQQDERRRQRKDAEEARRGQATRVAAWVWKRPNEQLWFLNASDLPVFDCQVWSEDEIVLASDIYPPTHGAEVASPRPDVALPRAGMLTVMFTDAAGRRWCRDAGGDLREIQASSLPSTEATR